MEKKWRKLIESLRRQEKQQGGKKEPDVSKLIILFLAGVFLLFLSLPTGSLSEKKDSTQKGTDKKQSQSTVQETAVSAMEEYAGKQERELEKVLSKVKGIGDVDVMVTIASSEENAPSSRRIPVTAAPTNRTAPAAAGRRARAA